VAIRRPITSEERAEIIQLLRKGNLSHREISRRVNRAQSSISAIARDASITPVKKLKRTPAATEVEGTFSRDGRISVADSAIGVISELLRGGGLSPRDLKETTAALKTALESRRMEDVEVDPEEAKKDRTTWLEALATPGESRGIGVQPSNGEVGVRMVAFAKAAEEGFDDFRAARNREQQIIDEMVAEAKAESEAHDGG
jgi:hypothetical protein